MRQLALVAVVAAGLTTPVRTHAPAPVTISGMSYLSDYSSGQRVKVYRGTSADVEVRGQFLDLATGVEVKTLSGASTSDVTASITARQGGANTRITVRVEPKNSAPLGRAGYFLVRIHYAVETSGPDEFGIELLDRGRVDQIQIVQQPAITGAYVAGQPYTLNISGARLGNAALVPALTSIRGLRLLPPEVPRGGGAPFPDATGAAFRVQFDSAGLFSLHFDDFVDLSLDPAPSSCADWCYTGSGSLTFRVAIQPAVSSISNRAPIANTTVTIGGTYLSVPGFEPRIQLLPRYGPNDPSVVATVSGANLQFHAPLNMRRDSIRLVYIPTGATQSSVQIIDPIIELPSIGVQGGTPFAFITDSLVSTSGVVRKLLMAGQRTLRGHFLIPNFPFSLAAPITGTVIDSRPPVATFGQTTPTLAYGGTPLSVVSSAYNRATSIPGQGAGADLVTFTMPALPDTATRELVVTTPFGSTTLSNVVFLPPPTVTSLVREVGNQQSVPVTDGRLFRNSQYSIGGVGLKVVAGGTVLHVPTIRLNGITIQSNQLASNSSRFVFTIPQGANTGPLTVDTKAGTTTVGAFTVENAPASVSIVGLQLSPVDVVGGNQVTGTVAFNGSIPTGTTAGNLVISQTQNEPSVTVPAPAPIASNPMTFQLATHAVNSVRTTFIQVTNEAGSSGVTQASSILRVHPPAPTELSLKPATVVGGKTVSGTVIMNGSANVSDDVLVSLAGSDPSSATVPASALVNGNTAIFTITTPVVTAPRTVTVTATSDGQSRSATITVMPPTISAITLNPTSPIGGTAMQTTLALTALAPAGQTATIACTGEGLQCPPTVALSGSSTSFNATILDVPSARDATLAATLNGVTKTATVSIQPFGVQSMTVSPTSVRGGTASSVTISLNRPAPGSGTLTLQLSSSDTSAAIVVPQVTFGLGELTKLVTITTRGPQTQPKNVTITASATRQTNFGPSTVTASARVTVTP